jgi:tRNA(His) 5'-end guanylyltransferase
MKSILDGVVVPKDNFIIIRCDARGFGKLLEKSGFKSYDKAVHMQMVKEAEKTIEDLFTGGMAYVLSDEISFVLPRSFDMYNRRVEKLLTVTAGFISGDASLEFCDLNVDLSPVTFDAKIFDCENINKVLEYLDERKNSGFRNFVFTTFRTYLMNSGMSATEVARKADKMPIRTQIDLLLTNGVDVHSKPYWQREGVMVCLTPYEKQIKVGSFGSRKKQTVTRKKITKLKPFRFCVDDAKKLKKVINSEYRGTER